LHCEVAQKKGLRSSKQLMDLQEKRNGLCRLIQNWREVQLAYMPHVASLLSSLPSLPEPDTDSSSIPPELLSENIPLFLPSALPPQIRCLPELLEICQLEWRLCEPQANDTLAAVQHHRRIIQGLWQFKRLNASGVGNKPNTKMVTLYKCLDHKIKQDAQEYRAAWRALGVLDPNGSWSIRLQDLKDKDIHGPGKEEKEASNSQYEPSWIWLVPHVTRSNQTDQEAEFTDSMRVEWAKARVRMVQWKEEFLLVQEEMRHVIEYLNWKAAWWCERSTLRTHTDTTVLSRISGYANKQAAICSRIAEQCARYWLPRLKGKGIMPLWASYFPSLSDLPPVDPMSSKS